MAAKKKTAAKKASNSSTASTPAPTRTLATSDDVLASRSRSASPAAAPERACGADADYRPDAVVRQSHSTYVDANANFPPDTGNQVEEIPGKPKSER
jgi:hypothetical protein